MLDLIKLATQFKLPGKAQKVETYGAGIINQTYLVTLFEAEPPITQHSTVEKVILQKINALVFPHPEQIIANYRCILHHINDQLQHNAHAMRSLYVPEIYAALDGKDYYQDSYGDFWRATRFVANTVSFDTLQDLSQAREVGYALGMFQRLLSDLPTSRLHDTLPQFHITPLYLKEYDRLNPHREVAAHHREMAQFCLTSIAAGRVIANVLESAKARLRLRVIHGDPKLNNILFSRRNGQAVSIIDLDTVKPGLIHYDVGDCMRSCCNLAGESPISGGEGVEFNVDVCQAIFTGYMAEANTFLLPEDYELLYDAILLLPFELGLRFYTDYLQGNIYFAVTSEEQNLVRAHTQFQLFHSIQRQKKAIQDIILQTKNQI